MIGQQSNFIFYTEKQSKSMKSQVSAKKKKKKKRV